MAQAMEKEDNHNVIYRPWTKTRDGRIIYAKDYGLKAFRIVLKVDKEKS